MAATKVQTAFAGQADLRWAEQAQQLGTGHALQQAMPAVPRAARVLVLYGDAPLIRADTLRRMLDFPGHLVVLAAELEDPTGYGRLVLDAQGRVAAIVEQNDVDERQHGIRLVNTGIVLAEAGRLNGWRARLRNWS